MHAVKNTYGAITPKTIGLENVTNDAQLKRNAGDFNSFTSEAIADDDIVLFEDSSDSFNKKKAKKKDMAMSKTEAIKNVLIYS